MYTLKSLKYLVFSAPVAFTALFSSNSAHAQMEYMAEIMQPEYMTRDLVLFAEGLNLDDMQEVIVEGFFDDYEDDFQAGWSATQERLNAVAIELRDKPDATDRDTLEPVLNALGDWVVDKRQLDDGLLENIKVILLPDQKTLWPAFSQRLYREKNIRRGRLSGESVDLFQITRDADLQSAAETAIAPHLEEYAIALDIAIRNRDSILRGNPKKLFDNILSGNNEKSPNLVDNAIKARVEVRDINDRYIELISENLSAVDGEDFRLRALKRGYTRVYRRTPAERILRQAADNELFSEGTRAQIAQLETAYLLELADLNYVLLQQTRSYEPALHKNRELAGQVRKNGGTPEKIDDPTRDMYKEREALGKRYIEMLQALLTPEEFLELDGARRWIPRAEQNNIAPAIAPSGKTGGLATTNPNHKGQDNSGKGSKGEEPGGKTSPRTSGVKGADKSGTGIGSPDQ
ncbi:MAG: hypothetical protein ACI9JK_000405 [Phycisphaerales bacterium]|jgi:hypothetical protein